MFVNIKNEYADIKIKGRDVVPLGGLRQYLTKNKTIPEDIILIQSLPRKSWFSILTDPDKFVFAIKDYNGPLDIAFVNEAEEVIKTYPNYKANNSEDPYCYNVAAVCVMRAGNFEKFKIILGTRISGLFWWRAKDLDAEKILQADKFFSYFNEVFAEKWNEKHNFNERFYFNYYDHIWRTKGGTQFSEKIEEFKVIQEKATILEKEAALEKIKSYDYLLTKDFQKYNEKYYRRDYQIFSYNEAENIAKIYDFLSGWKTVKHVINIAEFSVMHFTKDDIEKEIEKFKNETPETKRLMNLINLEDLDPDEFHKIGTIYQNKKNMLLFQVIPGIHKIFKFSCQGISGYKKIDLIDREKFDMTDMEEILPEKFYEAFKKCQEFNRKMGWRNSCKDLSWLRIPITKLR